jgi:PTH1 family peptidyl-tRNA hydrolase
MRLTDLFMRFNVCPGDVDWFDDEGFAAVMHNARVGAQVAKAAGDLRLLKPGTYMNLSGRSVAGLARFFAIDAQDMLVVHDELDLSPGEAKLKFGGGVAGHNGLRDVALQLGTPDFWRLRIGIGHPRDSAVPQQDVADYVLAPPLAAAERASDRKSVV